jgi:hypothetical protein
MKRKGFSPYLTDTQGLQVHVTVMDGISDGNGMELNKNYN